MYQIEINCQPTGGLAEHRDFISSGIKSSLASNYFSDLTFICGNRSFSSHQSMIGPLSPFLSAFFSQMNCCNCQRSYCGKKEVIQVHLPDIGPECMETVLEVIYTGKAKYDMKTDVDVNACLNLLGINIDLEIDEAVEEQTIDKELGFEESSIESFSRSASRRRIGLDSNKGNGAPNRSPNYRAKRKNKSLAALEVVDAKRMKTQTTRSVEMDTESSRSVEMQMVMLQELRNLDMGASIGCRMAGCGHPITLNQMTQHFQKHMMFEASGQSMVAPIVKEEPVEELEAKTPVTFPCDQCDQQFKFRRALDVHVKNYHRVVVTLDEQSLEDSLRDQISDSDSDDDLTVNDYSAEYNDNSLVMKEANELTCQSCNKMIKSEWHRLPFRHGCESMKKISQEPDRSLVCDLCNQTVESLWYKPPLRHCCPKIVSESQSLARIEPLHTREIPTSRPVEISGKQLYQDKCNLCNKVFSSQKSLKVHKNLAHSMENVTNVERKLSVIDQPKHENLNSKKSLMYNKSSSDALSKDKFFCQLCSRGFPEFRAMKTHYTIDHFWSNLNKQYGKWDVNCHICKKTYPTKSNLLQHMGNFHVSISIDKYLEADKYQVLTSENLVELVSFKCEICKVITNNSTDLKSHLSANHFNRQLIVEFSVGETRLKECPKCGVSFQRLGNTSLIAVHLGSTHDEVLKYALPYLKMDENDKALVAVDNFEEAVEELVFKEKKNDEVSVFDYLNSEPLEGLGTEKHKDLQTGEKFKPKKVDIPLKTGQMKMNLFNENNTDNLEGNSIREILYGNNENSTVEMKKENNAKSAVESDEDPDDPDDPSYVPSSEEEETVKTKGEIIIKDIKTLLESPAPIEAAAKPQTDAESSKALKPQADPKPQANAERSKDDCKCRNCGRMFDTPYKMHTHQRNCKWTCTRCNNAFNLQSEFSAHIGVCAGAQTIKA